MVRTLLKSALREIRQRPGPLPGDPGDHRPGRWLLLRLRLCQPAMMATGIDYVTQYKLFDFQLMSTLGYTEEDVAAFAALDGRLRGLGSVYTDFLMEAGDKEVVITARALTEGVNDPELAAGRMPEAANECLGDARYFTEEDLGTQVAVSPNNDEDTLDPAGLRQLHPGGTDALPLLPQLRAGHQLHRQRQCDRLHLSAGGGLLTLRPTTRSI